MLRDKTATSLSHENATKALWHLAQSEENQSAIPDADGIKPLVALLTKGSLITQQFSAAALEALAKEHIDNQRAIHRTGAIQPLVTLLGSESKETQEHAVSALLYLSANDESARNAVIGHLVAVLDERNAAAQMKAAEALYTIASRSTEHRRAVTNAKAIDPLVRLLGDGRRVRAKTPQERACALLADLARLGENKYAIAKGGMAPLVQMLSSEAAEVVTPAASTLWQLSQMGQNKMAIADAGAIPPLVALLSQGSLESIKFCTGTLWSLCAYGDNKAAMVNAGAIPPLVALLKSDAAEARENAAAVLSEIARSQGGNKKAIVVADGVVPMIELLSDGSIQTQKHAACALWGLVEGKEGIYHSQLVELNAVDPLIAMLLSNQPETRGFAAACLSCLCTEDDTARQAVIAGGGAEPLIALAYSPSTWLRCQAVSLLNVLGIPFKEPQILLPPKPSPAASSPVGRANGSPRGTSGYPLVSTKTLPIRVNKSVDPELDNPVVAVLEKGMQAWVLEKEEIGPSFFRALITLEPGGKAKGWVTSGKEGNDHLVSEQALCTCARRGEPRCEAACCWSGASCVMSILRQHGSH